MSTNLSRWTGDDVAGMLAADPSERLAFAPSRTSPARLAEILTAMANAHGGVVLLGATSSGRFTGIAGGAESRATCKPLGCSLHRR